ncbi:MAG TPA: ferric reductase-like transmembrane domain-containing protein [Polyangiaceae bacterium]|nr:ferric reductase-like transmembrane domain-containing protein [Polyangiaceae bacterium]
MPTASLPRARSVETHRWLATVALSLTGLHALALLGDRFIHFDALDLLIPLMSSYRSYAVALGVLAAYGALLVHASFSWRKRIGAKAWRRLHYVSFFVFVAALLHGMLAGSDSHRPGLLALYVSSATVVAVLAALRALGPHGTPANARRPERAR